MTGRMRGPAKSASLQRENLTMVYVSLPFCALHNFLQRRAEYVKPYNRTHIGTRQEHVFAEGKSHRSICLFTFCALRKFLQRRAENVKPFNSTHTRCRQESVSTEGKSHRSICLFTFCALRKILQRRTENVKPYNRTQARCRADPPRVRL